VVEHQVSLASRNTLALPGLAEYFCQIHTPENLSEALHYAGRHRLPVTVLGGGSNIVIADDVPGLVLAMAIRGCEIVAETDEHIDICYGAGENWHELVMQALGRGWYGLENLSLIPGCAGAAPIQNIGAYGVELDQCFQRLDAVSVEDGAALQLDRADCAFGYRDSIFKHELSNRVVITAVTLRHWKTPHLCLAYPALQQALLDAGIDLDQVTPEQVSATVCAIRRSKLPDPAAIANAGSFFKNPVVSSDRAAELAAEYPDLPRYVQADGTVKLPAAWLIDRAGWKGCRRGQVGVHDRQALVLVNHGGATGVELLALATAITDDIARRYRVTLEMEPRILGRTA